MEQSKKCFQVSRELILNNHLVHASITDDIKILEPRSNNKLYASNNICISILIAFAKYYLPQRSLILQEYCFCKQRFSVCSIAKEFLNDVRRNRITIYIVPIKNFIPTVKITSNLQRKSFSVIKTHGHEYISANEIKPIHKFSFTIDEFFIYSVHNIYDSKKTITLKWIKNYLTNRCS
ncbi:MAG: hypothetical protein GY756_18090 [bacterium]|nr:hypothetical protein [bacterium]